MYYKYKKICRKSQAVRAGSVRPRGLAGITKSMYLKQTAFTAAAGKVCTKTGQTAAPRPTKPKERAKKGKKEGLAGQKPRLSRSAGFRRPESGGGVCQPGGWLGCTLFAGSITEAAGAASETGWAALYTHFLPAELPEGVRLVYALFGELRPPCMHTFCKEPGAA